MNHSFYRGSYEQCSHCGLKIDHHECLNADDFHERAEKIPCVKLKVISGDGLLQYGRDYTIKDNVRTIVFNKPLTL